VVRTARAAEAEVAAAAAMVVAVAISKAAAAVEAVEAVEARTFLRPSHAESPSSNDSRSPFFGCCSTTSPGHQQSLR